MKNLGAMGLTIQAAGQDWSTEVVGGVVGAYCLHPVHHGQRTLSTVVLHLRKLNR